MANEQSGIPLRRWRPFYGAFGAIDEAIEASGHPRAAFQDVRARIVRLLRGATDDDVAEQLCAALDDAMAEALETLRVAPVPHTVLASTDLARAVGALGKHGSARIRSLASDVVRAWRTANDVARATAVKKLDNLSGDPIPCQSISIMAVAEGNVRRSVVPVAATEEHDRKKLFVPYRQNTSEKKKPIIPRSEKLETCDSMPRSEKPIPCQGISTMVQSKKLEAKKPIVAQSEKIDAKKPVMATQSGKIEAKKPVVAQSEKMATTKRKLYDGYAESKRLADLGLGLLVL